MHTEEDLSFKSATFSTITRGKNGDYLRKLSLTAPTVLSWRPSKHHQHPKQQFIRMNDATMVFEGKLYSPSHMLADHLVMENLPQENLVKLGEAMLENTEGDFTFQILEKDRIIAGRDSIGVEPLYYGENETIAALASSRKPLWKLGIEKPQSFPAGNLAVIDKKGFEFKHVKTLRYSEPEPMTMDVAAEKLQSLLEKAVRERVDGEKRIAVAFSGGLDSSLIAVLAKKGSANMRLFHVSLENQPETIEAQKAASDLKLPIEIYLYSEKDVENVLPEVVGIIEENDPVKTSIGVPLYWTAKKAAEEGFHVLLAGQGADELFGGYQRYINQYFLRGGEEVRKVMFDDVRRLHETNIERDAKICNFHNVELCLPFAAYQVVKFALKIPLEFKIERRQDSLRKLVLRKVANNLKIPSSIADKPKKAIQYGTGVNSAIKKIAKKRKMTVREYINKLFLMESR
jgi:asparagine synthase (glutamine-hydrolysing)